MRNRAQIEADDAANLASAKAQPGVWIYYEPRIHQGGGQRQKFAAMGLEIRKNDDWLQVRYVGQPQLGDTYPNELIGLTEELEAVRAEVEYQTARLRLAIEMVRIKDELITKQVARITYLEGRK